MTQSTGVRQAEKRRWQTPVVRRLDANRAENGSLVGAEAVLLLS